MTAPPHTIGAHWALMYRNPHHFDRVVTGFVRDGLERGEHTIAIAEPEKLERLRSTLGPASSAAVRFVDADGVYRRQGMVIRAVKDLLDAATAGGQPARLVGEQVLGSLSATEIAYYLRLEAVANVLFASYPATVLCLYDSAALPAEVLEGCQRTHRELLDDTGLVPSGDYVDPGRFVVENTGPVVPPADAATFPFDKAEDLAAARAFLREQATEAGLSGTAVVELVTGASEVLANAVVHGDRPRQLWVYPEDGALVVHVRDRGRGFADPVGAYLPPELRSADGQRRGTWIAQQMSDAVELVTSATGTDVRLFTTFDRHTPPSSN